MDNYIDVISFIDTKNFVGNYETEVKGVDDEEHIINNKLISDLVDENFKGSYETEGEVEDETEGEVEGDNTKDSNYVSFNIDSVSMYNLVNEPVKGSSEKNIFKNNKDKDKKVFNEDNKVNNLNNNTEKFNTTGNTSKQIEGSLEKNNNTGYKEFFITSNNDNNNDNISLNIFDTGNTSKQIEGSSENNNTEEKNNNTEDKEFFIISNTDKNNDNISLNIFDTGNTSKQIESSSEINNTEEKNNNTEDKEFFIISNTDKNNGNNSLNIVDTKQFNIIDYQIKGSSEHKIIDTINADEKDSVIKDIIPDKISKCALNIDGPICSSDETIKEIADKLEIKDNQSSQKILNDAKDKLHCNTEKCVIEKVGTSNDLSRFKISGPLSTDLLNNMNIDSILKQWETIFPGFYAYNFNMLNYMEWSFRNGRTIHSPDTLHTINLKDLYNKNYRTFGCIINSDTYQGPGKHWMALFVDCREEPFTIEFFNSSGNPPVPEFQAWQIKSKHELESLNKSVKVILGNRFKHQNSKTECGVYSLFYIYARLKNIPYTYFSTNRVSDKFMFEFRHHLYDNDIDKFDWKYYYQNNNVRWE